MNEREKIFPSQRRRERKDAVSALRNQHVVEKGRAGESQDVKAYKSKNMGILDLGSPLGRMNNLNLFLI